MVVAVALLVAGCQPIQPETVVTPPTPASDVLTSEVVSTTGSSQVEASPAITADTVVTPTGEIAAATDPALVAMGLEVYHKAYCGVCHELAAAGTTGTFGPSHDGIGTIASERVTDPNYSGKAKTAGEYLYESLLEPEAYFAPGFGASMHRMPAFSHLSQADLDALVAFLLAQK
jgi:mono/diheme cytochrome c family protein